MSIIAALLCTLFMIFSSSVWAKETIQNADGTTTTIEPDEVHGKDWTKETTRTAEGEITKEEFKFPNGKTYQIKYTSKQANGTIRKDTVTYQTNGKPNWTKTENVDNNGNKIEETVFYDKDGATIISGSRLVTAPNGDTFSYVYGPATKTWKNEWKTVKGADGQTKDFKFNPQTNQWEEFKFQWKYTFGAAEMPTNLKKTAQQGYEVATVATGPLNTVSFTTEHGKINVNLTNDLAVGDSISGTVMEEPKGKNDKERSKNQGELHGYVIEVAGKQTPVSSGAYTCDIPRTLTEATRTVNLIYKGKKVASTEIPILEIQPATQETFTVPTGGQQGQPLEVTGPCDGKITETDYVKVGDTTLPVLAESPRKKIVANNNPSTGPDTIECSEHDVLTECPFRNIGIQLWADKLNLRSGETTKAGAKVIGLSGIIEDLPLDLVASGAIEMQGGNTQHRTIIPSQVDATGTYPIELSLTGTAPGSFGITATVQWVNACTIDPNDRDGVYQDIVKKLDENADTCSDQAEKERQLAEAADDPLMKQFWESMAHNSDFKAAQDRDIIGSIGMPALSLPYAHLRPGLTSAVDVYMDNVLNQFILDSLLRNDDLPKLPDTNNCADEMAAVQKAQAAANESRKAWNEAWDALRKAKDQVEVAEQREKDAQKKYEAEKKKLADSYFSSGENAVKAMEQWVKAGKDLDQARSSRNRLRDIEESALQTHKANMAALQRAEDKLADCLNALVAD